MTSMNYWNASRIHNQSISPEFLMVNNYNVSRLTGPALELRASRKPRVQRSTYSALSNIRPSLNPNMISVNNPRDKSILECAHAIINSHLLFLRALDPKQIIQDSNSLEKNLMPVAFSIHSSDNATTRITPVQLVFGRYM